MNVVYLIFSTSYMSLLNLSSYNSIPEMQPEMQNGILLLRIGLAEP